MSAQQIVEDNLLNKMLAAAAVAVSLVVVSGAAHAQSAEPTCDVDRPIVFAGLDWDSPRFQNALARYILEHGYGCETDAIPGSSLPLLTGMARGDIDVTMEVWIPNLEDAWERVAERGQVADVGTSFPDATQNWCVPDYLVEGEDAPAPDLQSVSDLPQYKDLFADPEAPGKGRFYNCKLGWGCEVVSTKKLHAYGLTEDYTNFRPGTVAALLSAVESALLQKEPVLFYCWAPSWMMGKWGDQITKLEEPAYDEEIWNELTETDDPEDVEQATAFPLMEVTIGANTEFIEEAPTIVEFLGDYSRTSDLISEGLAYMQENEASVEEAAQWFLNEREEVWTDWVSPDVAERVRTALAEE